MYRIVKIVVFLMVLIFQQNYSFAQYNGYPIRNYTPKEYGAFMQNWYCVQDSRGVLYFGNSSNVLEYDGRNWKKIPIVSGVAIRELCISKSGVIYVGAVGDFGYLKPLKNGEFVYRSLKDLIPASAQKFSDVWSVSEIDGAMVFQASENIYIYRDEKIEVVPPTTNTFASIAFDLNNALYFRERKIGLMKLSGNKISLLAQGEKLHNSAVIGMINYPLQTSETMLAFSVDEGFYNINEKAGTIERFPQASEQTLLEVGVLGMKWFNDSTIVMNTRSGVYFLNKDLRITNSITKQDGLADESVSSIFVDAQNEMWLSTNNGISKVSVHSPFYFYNATCGLDGNIEVITLFNDHIYVGTTSGMFVSPLFNNNHSGPPSKLKFTKVSGTYFETWNFKSNKDQLFAATSDGVFEIKGDKAIRVTKGYANTIYFPEDDPDVFFIGEKDGLHLMQRTASAWKEKQYYAFPAIDIMNVITESYSKQKGIETLWFATRGGGASRMLFNKETFTLDQFDIKNGLPDEQVYLAKKGGEILFNGTQHVYHFDPSTQSFKILNKNIAAFNHNAEYILLLDEEYKESAVTYKAIRSIEDQGYSYFQSDSAVLWIGLTTVLTRYDSKVQKNKNNTIQFLYASPYYDREEKLLFSYRLIGFDSVWSEWSADNKKQYTNLFEGEYTFEVKAKNLFDHESSVGRYSFTILAPWYRSVWAYILYFIVFIIVVFVIVRLSVWRLRNAKIKLEKVVMDRTAEVVKQKEELLEKNTIIEVAYNDIKSSINYAKRIQEAILPLNDEIKKQLKDSFILFKPRDIVSGDFYWFSNHNGKKIMACVDCTGHGVPGAFMSMIGHTLLNEIVIEKNITKPASILDLLHVRVRQSLKQNLETAETRDGMDISICVFNEDGKTLEYAGANRNLIIVRSGELIEIKADKQPIGGDQMEQDRIFTNHKIDVFTADTIYMTTDGYADQFGGDKGKKFMVKRFHQTLLSIQNESMEKQGQILGDTIEKWKGENEQVDDILVIGIKIA
ncbi:MAG: SpoIIE family protein phosphatase [Bacteroidia bacterium]|nr:SpoIIE family protein phosphatase [Bacteroidia bacterium]